MNILKGLLTMFFLTVFALASNAQISNANSKTSGNKESNGLKSSAVKTDPGIDLGQSQRSETIAQMEKQEKELLEMAMKGDGRTSKTEAGILNNARILKETMK